MAALKTEESHRCFGGVQGIYRHASTSTGTPMTFSVFTPPQAASGPVPVLFYLSGLTCTCENFTVKAGAQKYAAEHGLMLVAPDTSPRGDGVPDAEGDFTFGQGAGWYVDATVEPWAQHYKMYSYCAKELPDLIAEHFPADPKRMGITGHSMGGHGALTLALRHPDRFRSVSALSAIVAPMKVAWGQRALRDYLGGDEANWRGHDACELIRDRGWHGDILLSQGDSDPYFEGLRPDYFESACSDAGVDLTLRMHDGYDHSYYFVATVIDAHVEWHAERLKA